MKRTKRHLYGLLVLAAVLICGYILLIDRWRITQAAKEDLVCDSVEIKDEWVYEGRQRYRVIGCKTAITYTYVNGKIVDRNGW